MFKKPKKNFRLREPGVRLSDDEVEVKGREPSPMDADIEVIETAEMRRDENERKKKDKKKAAKAAAGPAEQSLLSFGDDLEGDDGEVFKVKKSSQSKKLRKLMQKERVKPKMAGNDGIGDVEDEVRTGGKEILDEDNKPFLRVKDMPLPVKRPEDREGEILTGLEAESTVMEREESSEEEDGVVHQHNPAVRSGSNFSDPFKRMLESGVVPTAAMIHEARKRRQRARELGESADVVRLPPKPGKDFIEFGERKEPSRRGSEERDVPTSKKSEAESRLVREEDHDRSDDEGEGDVIAFAYNRVAKEKEKRREIFMDAEGEAESEGEAERWEAQQIRKGFGSSNQREIIRSTAVAAAATEAGHFAEWGSAAAPMTYEDARPFLKTSSILGEASFKSLTAMSEGDLTCSSIRNRIKSKMTSLMEVHRRHKLDRDKVADDLITSQLDIDNSKTKKPEAASKYSYYQELRGFMADFVDCMDEKVATIEALEARMLGIWRTKSQRLIDRRRQDVKDEHEELSELSSNRGQPNFKKFQRANDEEFRRRVTEREGRRLRRKRARETDRKKILSAHLHFEGMSSDDEEQDGDTAKLQEETAVIRSDAKLVFDDTVEDFYVFASLKEKFRAWKARDLDAYKNAFVPMCLPKVFSPLVRLAMVFWNPLDTDQEEFESMDWFTELVLFSAYEAPETDPDVKLVSMVVERFIIPKLTTLVTQVWDPLSTSQTLRLVRLVKRLSEDYPTVSGQSKHVQKLLKGVVERMQWTLENDIFVPLYAKPLLTSRPEVGAFLGRQFWVCAKALQNFVSWQGILSDKTLQNLAVDSLLNRYMLLALNQSVGVFPPAQNVVKIRQIACSLPRCWFAGGKSLPQLCSLSRLIKELAENVDVFGKESRDLVTELSSTLKKMGFAEMADEVSSIKLES